MATAAEQWMERGKELGKQEGLLTAIELGLELKIGHRWYQHPPASTL